MERSRSESRSGSLPLTYGSGFGSGRSKNLRILRTGIRVRIRNTGKWDGWLRWYRAPSPLTFSHAFITTTGRCHCWPNVISTAERRIRIHTSLKNLKYAHFSPPKNIPKRFCKKNHVWKILWPFCVEQRVRDPRGLQEDDHSHPPLRRHPGRVVHPQLPVRQPRLRRHRLHHGPTAPGKGLSRDRKELLMYLLFIWRGT